MMSQREESGWYNTGSPNKDTNYLQTCFLLHLENRIHATIGPKTYITV